MLRNESGKQNFECRHVLLTLSTFVFRTKITRTTWRPLKAPNSIFIYANGQEFWNETLHLWNETFHFISLLLTFFPNKTGCDFLDRVSDSVPETSEVKPGIIVISKNNGTGQSTFQFLYSSSAYRKIWTIVRSFTNCTSRYLDLLREPLEGVVVQKSL